jgi:hypothetical protein
MRQAKLQSDGLLLIFPTKPVKQSSCYQQKKKRGANSVKIKKNSDFHEIFLTLKQTELTAKAQRSNLLKQTAIFVIIIMGYDTASLHNRF